MDPGAGNFGWGPPQQQQPQQMHGDGSGAYGAYPPMPLQGSTSADPYDTYLHQQQQPGQQYPAMGTTIEHYQPQHPSAAYPGAGPSYAYPGSGGDPTLQASSYPAPPSGYPSAEGQWAVQDDGSEQQQCPGDEAGEGDRGLEQKLNYALHKKHKILHPIDHAKWKLGKPVRVVKKTAQLVGLKK